MYSSEGFKGNNSTIKYTSIIDIWNICYRFQFTHWYSSKLTVSEYNYTYLSQSL